MIASESSAASGARSWSGNRQIPWRHIAIYALAAILSAWLSVSAQPTILGDDAAIGLRYAERLANGQGFTYNDHERVCGASNPLWTLLISLGPRVGLDVERTARVLASAFYVLAAVLASAVAMQTAGVWMGLLVAFAVPVDTFWRTQGLAGLEVPLALFLGLAAILASNARRDVLAGGFLGLALVTKLDAAALILAVTAASVIAHRRLPVRTLVSAALVSLPWFLFAWAYFGRPWPQSLTAKLTHGSEKAMHHLWVVEFMAFDTRYLLWVLGVMGLVVSAKATPSRRMIVVSIFGWFLIHSAGYSVVNLGDLYPWYLAIPAALTWLAASGAAAAGTNGWKAVVAVVLVLVAIPHWRQMLAEARNPPSIALAYAIDSDRRLAGVFIDQFAAPTEVVESGFGWVAYEGRRTFIDGSGLNSRMTLPSTYVVLENVPTEVHQAAPPGYVPLARFDLVGHLFPGRAGFTVYGQRNSAIAMAGRTEDDVDAERLRDHTLATAWRQFRREARSRSRYPSDPR